MKNKKIYRCYYSFHITTKDDIGMKVNIPIHMETADTLTELSHKMEERLRDLIRVSRKVL